MSAEYIGNGYGNATPLGCAADAGCIADVVISLTNL